MLSISYKKSECKFFLFVHFIQCCSMEVWKVDGKVSISESRCFSFQVEDFAGCVNILLGCVLEYRG